MSASTSIVARYLPAFLQEYYLNADVHTKELIKGSLSAFVFQVIGTILGFLFNVVLARLLGAEDTGIYFLAFSIVTILAVFGRCGMDNSLIRFVAANAATENWSAVKGVYLKCVLYALLFSSLLGSLVIIGAPWIVEVCYPEIDLIDPLRLMLLAVVPFGLTTLHANALRGMKHISSAVSLENIWVRLFTIIGAYVLIPAYGLMGGVGAYVIGSFMGILLGVLLWRKATPQLTRVKGHFSTDELFRSSIPLFGVVISSLMITWSPILLLGIWASEHAVAVYGVAHRTALLMAFFMFAVNSIAAPKFAVMYQEGDMQGLENMARLSAKTLMLMACPLLLIFVLMPGLVMQIFGDEFVQGARVLSILAIGQYIIVATGSVGFLLMMSGHEKLMRNNLVACAALNVIMNIILIPWIGIHGAAIATSVTLAVQGGVSFVLVWMKLDIVTLPCFRRRR